MKNKQRCFKAALIAAQVLVSLGLSLLTLHLCCMCMSAAFKSGQFVLLIAWAPLVVLNAGCISLLDAEIGKILEHWKNK